LVQEEKYLGEKVCGKKQSDDGDDDDNDENTVGVLIRIFEINLTVLWNRIVYQNTLDNIF
jgi:hypothetical protein